MLSFQWKDQFYIGGQLENVVVTLTYGDYNHGNRPDLESGIFETCIISTFILLSFE